MRIDAAIQSYVNPVNSKDSQAARRISKETASTQTKRLSEDSKHDRVELSQEAQDAHDRLARVRARLESGYYQSQEVDEDISEKLSKYFEETIREL